MKTPEEEAKEIIKKHCNILRPIMTNYTGEQLWIEGKKHAIAEVDGILHSFPDCEIYDIPIEDYENWQSVRQAIEKM